MKLKEKIGVPMIMFALSCYIMTKTQKYTDFSAKFQLFFM